MDRPLLPLALGFGLTFYALGPLPPEVWPWLLLGFYSLFLAFWAAWQEWSRLPVWAETLGWGAAGGALAGLLLAATPTPTVGAGVVSVGTVTFLRPPDQRGRPAFEWEDSRSRQHVLVRLKATAALPRVGQHIEVTWQDSGRPVWHPWARLNRMARSWQPEPEAQAGFGDHWASQWESWRLSARSAVFGLWDGWPPQATAFARAFLLGDTADLGSSEAEAFRLSGVSHILALSGLHLTLVGGGFFLFLRPAAGKKPAQIAVAVLLLGYAWLAGPIPSLLRALIMYLLSVVLFWLRQPLDFLPLLALTFVVATLLFPWLALDLGFQLSCLCLAGIAWLGPWFQPVLIRWTGRVAGPALAASLGAVLASAPLVVGLFGEVRPVGMVAGLILEPLTQIFAWLCLLSLPLLAAAGWFGPPAWLVLNWLTGQAASGLTSLTFAITGWGAVVPALPGWAALGITGVAGLVSLVKFRYKRRMEPAKPAAALKYPVGLNYDSPSDIRQLLDSLGLNTLKRWGQNFLINAGARAKILGALDLQPGEPVWEVGPGLGAMTHTLVAQKHPLTVFEIDPGYIDFLTKEFGSASAGFRVVAGDVVKTWKREIPAEGHWPKVIGNLPYNAASAILGSFIEGGFFPPTLVITVQKEMADRMTASVGSKNYSSFSILCQSAFVVTNKGDLKPGSFFPPPEVTSTIIQLKPHRQYDIKDRVQFHTLVREIYSSRRKTLRNNIPGTATALRIDEKALLQAFLDEGIDLKLRAETLTIKQFVALANRVAGLGKPESKP